MAGSSGGASGGVRQPAAESGSAGPAFAGATRRACGAEFCASVRYRRNGPVVGEGSRQRAQEAVATSRGLQPGAVDAGLVWSGQAQSRARPWGRVHFCDFAALSGLYENLTARGAAPADQAAPLPVAIEWAVAFKNGRFRDGLLATRPYQRENHAAMQSHVFPYLWSSSQERIRRQ